MNTFTVIVRHTNSLPSEGTRSSVRVDARDPDHAAKVGAAHFMDPAPDLSELMLPELEGAAHVAVLAVMRGDVDIQRLRSPQGALLDTLP